MCWLRNIYNVCKFHCTSCQNNPWVLVCIFFFLPSMYDWSQTQNLKVAENFRHLFLSLVSYQTLHPSATTSLISSILWKTLHICFFCWCFLLPGWQDNTFSPCQDIRGRIGKNTARKGSATTIKTVFLLTLCLWETETSLKSEWQNWPMHLTDVGQIWTLEEL